MNAITTINAINAINAANRTQAARLSGVALVPAGLCQYGEQVRAFIPAQSYRVLGTDGFGRSDSRENLRRHFEVNEGYIVVAALTELASLGQIDKALVAQAIAKFGIDADKITHSVIIGSGGLRQPWPCARFEDLTPEHFAQLAGLETELVIFGSGRRNRFPPPPWLAPLIARRLGLETMDTQAACRTYNVLVSENRRVAAALLFA